MKFENIKIIKIQKKHNLLLKAASYFSSKWGIPVDAYIESIEDSFSSIVPSWYVALDGEKIIGGLGVIENDFHNRPDLTPNVCAVYVNYKYRNNGIAGKMLNFVVNDMAKNNIKTLYLLTDHEGFYEKYGWKYYCEAIGDGEEKSSRMYIHVIG